MRSKAGCEECNEGIMTLYGVSPNGMPNQVRAPCLSCSPSRSLEELEREKDERIIKKKIREHNERTGW